jgi:predicted alpha/beta superfamily hydrolase
LERVIIVGIGYPTEDGDELESLRLTDMLPTQTEFGGGGSADFLGFIQEELIPYIDANYRTDPPNHTLAGHSAGGLFTLYALFHATETFQRYVVMSPALAYDSRLAFQYEETYAAEHHDLPVELFVSAGELEGRIATWMVPCLVEFHQRVEDRAYSGLEMEIAIMEEASHMSSFPGAITRGMMAVFQKSYDL